MLPQATKANNDSVNKSQQATNRGSSNLLYGKVISEQEFNADTSYAGYGQEITQAMYGYRHTSVLQAKSLPVSKKGFSNKQFIQRVPLPNYHQGSRNDTCQPAGFVTALMLWDRERADPVHPNDNIVRLCNAALIYLHQHRSQLISSWSTPTRNGVDVFNNAITTLTTIRNTIRTAGSTITENDYQSLSLVLANIDSELSDLLAKLGLNQPVTTDNRDTIDLIFTSAVLTTLRPGQVAQIQWYVNTTNVNSSTGASTPSLGYHAFLIGRSQTGEWFLSDQGNPGGALQLIAPDLAALRTQLNLAASTGRSWIVTNPAVSRIPMTRTGVFLLERQNFDSPHRQLLLPGSFIAEIDAGAFTSGTRVHAWDYIGIGYSLGEAQGLFSGSGLGHGFIIGEMPAGVFNVYKTNPISEANVNETSIDSSDSTGGILLQSPRIFIHTWLKLRTAASSGGSFFQVY